MTQNAEALLLFLNIPFCPKQCAYCTRAIRPLNTLDTLPAYIAALRKEVQAFAAEAEDRTVAGVWVGGGIAGHLFDEELGDLLQDMRRWYNFAPDAEVTLKVHPGMVSVETLNACHRGKVQRLSIEYATGDSFENEALERFLPPSVMDTTALVLGGEHTMQRSFDVLIGAPGQTPATLIRTLENVCKYGAVHVALYPFRMEVGSRYAPNGGKLAGGAWFCGIPVESFRTGGLCITLFGAGSSRLRTGGFWCGCRNTHGRYLQQKHDQY
jgi:oxygen-independent coproporphyrinogen-3 oxidase